MLFLSALFTPNAEHNSITVINNLLKVLRVKVSKTSVKKNLEEHPDYPSLLSISDALTGWKIENVSVRTDSDKLKQLPTPFIAALKQGKNIFFTVVKSFSETQLVISETASTNWKIISYQDFLRSWTGTVTLIEPEDGAGEVAYRQNHKQELIRQLVPATAIILLLAVVVFIGISSLVREGLAAWPAVALLSLKLFGSYVGGLLLWYEIDKSNVVLQKVCSGGKSVNCNAVLHSSASKLFGVFSWSELGFVYFLGGLICLLVSGLHPSMVILAVLLNVLALPYIVFSIYYQWRVVKQWCILCLSVQAVLAVEALVAFTGGLYSITSISKISFNQSLAFSFCFIFPFISWLLVKPFLISAKENNKNKKELIRLKHNTQIFESLLLRQKQITDDTSGLGLILGNPKAKNKLIKVCNPYCGPCAQAHPEIDHLLENNPDLQVQIIFTASSDEKDIKAAPVRHLLAIAEKHGEVILSKALDDWYNAPVQDYQVFAAKYEMNGELQKQNHRLDAMKAWCGKVDIAHTPTFFINGFQLPDMYSVRDLKYFLT